MVMHHAVYYAFQKLAAQAKAAATDEVYVARRAQDEHGFYAFLTERLRAAGLAPGEL